MDYLRSKFSKKTKRSSATASASASALTDDENQSGNGLTIEYFQSQLILNFLMRITYTPTDHKELIAMCHEQINNNPNELPMLNNFEKTYSSDRALWWYLQDSFLYKILNYSLESEDIGNLYLFRKVLHDINHQMEEYKCSIPLHAYRSQLLPIELLDRWISSVGQCVVINSFLSATTNQEVALRFLSNSQTSNNNNNCERVLLEIDADPRIIGSKPFVQTDSLNNSNETNEVLFMFGSIFLINNITCGNDGLYRIELTLYSDNDHEFKQVFEDMKKKYNNGEINLLTFAKVLKDLDRFNEAEEYINRYIESLPSGHDDIAQCYDLLGSLNLSKGDFEISLKWYNQALEFRIRKLSKSGDPRIADNHENIGDVYCKQGSYDLALKHYMTSLEIKSKTLQPQHPSIGGTLENIGRIYESMKDYRQALGYLQRACAIYCRALSPTHDRVIQIEEHIQRIANNVK